jgi:DNA primase
MIDNDTVQRILDVAQVFDVVSDYVSLKKRGVNYLGLCPFHNERTPSFIVSPSKGIFKCFGCGKGGNSVNFLMEIEHLTYPDALRFLAKKYHIEIQEKELSAEELASKNERESLMVASSFAQKFFTETLHNHKEGRAIGLSYFKERGFSDQTIEKFQLGYSLDSRDAFTSTAKKQGFSLDILVKTGLTISKDTYTGDRFYGRVMFPIHNISGRVIAFGGRVLKLSPNTGKYLNSPETEIYHKSDILYGIFQAKQAITRVDKCFLVEGYTDVISMHQAGIENVVASSGTSLTVNQIRLIHRFTENLTVLYDGDAAGIKAAVRGIDLVLEEGMNVKVLLFPDGDDPDSFARKHTADEIAQFIHDNETDFIRFKTNLLLKDAQADPIKKASLITDIVRTISIIPDTVKRSVYMKECSVLLDVDERALYQETANQKVGKTEQQMKVVGRQVETEKAKTIAHPSSPVGLCESTEREVIRVLLNYGNMQFHVAADNEDHIVAGFVVSEILSDDLQFENQLYANIFQKYIEHLEDEIIPDAQFFSSHPDTEISYLAADLLAHPHTLSKIWFKDGSNVSEHEFELADAIPKIVLEFKSKKVGIILKDLEMQMKDATSNEELIQIMSRIMEIKEVSKQIAAQLGERVIH